MLVISGTRNERITCLSLYLIKALSCRVFYSQILRCGLAEGSVQTSTCLLISLLSETDIVNEEIMENCGAHFWLCCKSCSEERDGYFRAFLGALKSRVLFIVIV